MADEPETRRNAAELRSWQGTRAKTVTFIVTEDCQLRCRYCYIVGKNNIKRMDFEVARVTIDRLLREPELSGERSVIFDFIGGEPFLEIDLIDRITDYAKLRMYETGHHWFDSYRLSFSTNGLLYGSKKVQRYIAKNRKHVSIGMSIDGTPAKHNAQRVFPDGSGSYDAVVRNVPLWLKQFPGASTKATVAHADLPFLKDSVIHLFDLGIRNVSMNVVFEDVWQDGDDLIFEDQLRQLADHIIANDLDRTHVCTLFSKTIGQPLGPENNDNWCGAGKMLAIDPDGYFYPCIRFAPFSLTQKPGRSIGDCFAGIDRNRLRPFLALTRSSQSPGDCLTCDVASGCAWCSGCNYDLAQSDTIFERAVHICSMHKARVRANRSYWDRLASRDGRGIYAAPSGSG
ncbi:MAG: radical SAM peptide maturase, CXXX-repeat target family [Ancalomicrobiaceae bacterium]|nr:radical SAM peptide maturase, CXXX-repeat target family [Ancalomicrobiaceae bacterium]